MKCHYEILEVSRDASSDDIKKSYRKLAIRWHPDKNLGNTEEATEQFQLVQQAFEVLSDPHERAWYDDHREAILKGKVGDQCDDESLDLYPYFLSSCYRGFGDDEKGFYSVYREVFNKIAAEDSEYQTEEDSDFEVPSFGRSNSSHEEVKGFYDYWQSYFTKKSYSWLDPFDTRQSPNRRVARAMEKENKKVRDKARKSRSDEIKELVSFVRKRDKRVQAYAQYLQEVSAEKAKKSEEIRREKIKARNSELASHKESDWAKFSNLENELKNIEANLASEFGDAISSENSDVEEEDIDQNLYCVACNRLFKNPKAFENHENSKKHKDNVQVLKEQMHDSDDNSELDNDSVINEEDDDDVVCGEEDENDTDEDIDDDDDDESDSSDSTKDDTEEKVAEIVDEPTENSDAVSDSEFLFDGVKDTGEDPLFCKSCGKWFKTEKAVKNHKTSQTHIKNAELYKEILKTLGSDEDTGTDTDNDFRTSSGTGSENDSLLDKLTYGKGNFKEDLERMLSKFDDLERIESQKLHDDVEKICAQFDEIVEKNDEVERKLKTVKKKKKSKNVKELEDSTSDDFDFSFGQSKKQKRKQTRQQILTKHKAKTNKPVSKKSVDESVQDESVANEKSNNQEFEEVPPVSQTSDALDDDYSTIQTESDIDPHESSKSIPPKQSSSSKNYKKNQDKNTCVNTSSDLNTSCATCKATFPSKNKLFLHLTKTKHSVYLPEKCSEAQEVIRDGGGKKGKNKKNKK